MFFLLYKRSELYRFFSCETSFYRRFVFNYLPTGTGMRILQILRKLLLLSIS